MKSDGVQPSQHPHTRALVDLLVSKHPGMITYEEMEQQIGETVHGYPAPHARRYLDIARRRAEKLRPGNHLRTLQKVGLRWMSNDDRVEVLDSFARGARRRARRATAVGSCVTFDGLDARKIVALKMSWSIAATTLVASSARGRRHLAESGAVDAQKKLPDPRSILAGLLTDKT